jgi:hypothetical protein
VTLFAPARWISLFVLTGGLWLLGGGCTEPTSPVGQGADPAGAELPFAPRTYAIYRTLGPVQVDGRLAEAGWQAAPWTAAFGDIRGPEAPPPRHRTRAKMLWDDTGLYVAARLQEPHVWGTLTQRDTVVYYDDDFEVFIDPNGTTHNYYEVEVNALETVWDLMLLTPYRDGGPAVDAWDMRDVQAAVYIDGTLNDPSDTDDGWTVEMWLPWTVLEEAAPEGRPPQDGEQWRLNFSRVDWPLTVENGRYRKDLDTTRAHPEDNWTWSPQGVIDMHRPERWGIVQFADAPAGTASVEVSVPETARIKWALRRLYYRQRQHRAETGRYAATLSALDAADISLDGQSVAPTLQATHTGYEITAPGPEGTTVHLRSDGKTWTTTDE